MIPAETGKAHGPAPAAKPLVLDVRDPIARCDGSSPAPRWPRSTRPRRFDGSPTPCAERVSAYRIATASTSIR